MSGLKCGDLPPGFFGNSGVGVRFPTAAFGIITKAIRRVISMISQFLNHLQFLKPQNALNGGERCNYQGSFPFMIDLV